MLYLPSKRQCHKISKCHKIFASSGFIRGHSVVYHKPPRLVVFPMQLPGIHMICKVLSGNSAVYHTLEKSKNERKGNFQGR